MRQIRIRLRVPVTLAVTTALAIPLSLPAQAEGPKPPKGAAQGWSDTTQQQKKLSLMPSAIPAKDRLRPARPGLREIRGHRGHHDRRRHRLPPPCGQGEGRLPTSHGGQSVRGRFRLGHLDRQPLRHRVRQVRGRLVRAADVHQQARADGARCLHRGGRPDLGRGHQAAVPVVARLLLARLRPGRSGGVHPAHP